MKYKNVLFIIPGIVQTHDAGSAAKVDDLPSEPHCGIGYLCEVLQGEGIRTSVVDMRLGYSVEYVKERIRETGPDLVGISCITLMYRKLYGFIAALKSDSYPIVLGGPHVSLYRAKVLEDTVADFAIKHEAERALLELCQGVAPGSIKNLIYRDGAVIENDDAPLCRELDELSFPKYRGFEMDKYGNVGIITSRGCPYACIFCVTHSHFGKGFRMRSAESVFSEIKYWYDKGERTFSINDDNFTLVPERVTRLCRMIREGDMTGLTLLCPTGIRADKVTRELLADMKSVGFRHMLIGVESGSERVLKIIKKGETLAQIENAIQTACELGYDVGLSFIIGSPTETEADVRLSFALARKYPVSIVFFFNLIPFPGTELNRFVSETGRWIGELDDNINRLTHFDNTPLFDTPELLAEKRTALLMEGAAVSLEVKRANFKRGLKRKFGVAGTFLALFYTRATSRCAIRVYHTRLGRSLITVFMRRLGLYRF
ncbi:MAG: radical SAM protein [Fibrobacterota bacterium]